MRTLVIIGGRQGIGEVIWERAQEQASDWRHFVPVNQKEVDVHSQFMLGEFARDLWETGHRELDIVYCAGINILGKIGELNEVDITEHYDVNVVGFIRMLDAFKQTHGESRVNITAIVSDSSRIPMRGSIMYASSKAALAHAIRCSARELAPTWRVNGVSPGVVADTPMTDYVDSIVPNLRGWTLEEAQSYERSLIPMGRRVTKDEVADLVLQTTIGPDFMTGAIIDIAGGK